MNINQAFASLAQNGGFSYNINTGDLNPKHGYMVAVSKTTERIVRSAIRYKVSALRQEIEQYIKDNSELLASNSNYVVGAWQDGKDLYLDVSELIEDLQVALHIALERNQLAIFSNVSKQTIFLKPVNDTYGNY